MGRYVDADVMINNLKKMKTQLGYDAIEIDGMIKGLEREIVDNVIELPFSPKEEETKKALEKK